MGKHNNKEQLKALNEKNQANGPSQARPGAPLCEDFSPADNALKVKGLRSLLKAHGLAAFIVPSGDAHSSEYVSDADKRREWLTGFTGSAGTALVTADAALVWTDGRYFTQAAQQLEGTEWQLMRSHEPGVPTLEEWVKKASLPGPVGADPRLVSLDFAEEWTAKGCAPLQLVEGNLVDTVWKKQPPVSCNPVKPHPLEFSGERVADKLLRVGTDVHEAGCGALVLNALDQLCWLFNLRGADIECNPVFLGYTVLTVASAPADEPQSKKPRVNGGGEDLPTEATALRVHATLYLRALDPDAAAGSTDVLATVRAHLQAEGCVDGGAAQVELAPYAAFGAEEAARVAGVGGDAGGLVMLERGSATQAMAAAIPTARRKLVPVSPVERLKAKKNAAEVRGLLSAGCKDAAAVVSYFAWLEGQLGAGTAVSEAEGADEIARRRKNMPGCVGNSFPTISSTGANAAVIHYQPKHGECSPIDPQALYLCDTGGQYLDGTTDVTRTLHFGVLSGMPPTDDERRAYTRVLQGHIDLATAVFPAGTPGMMLETLARAPLWRDGMNFLHGTGHGMGAYLNVHEGPAGIGGGATHIEQVSEARRRMYLHPIEEGQYVSDEPGFYREGAFGIRLEADLVVEARPTKYAWGSRAYLGFKYCTPVPFCRELIDVALLEPAQRRWLDEHHARCREQVTHELLREAAAGDAVDFERSASWLERVTRPL